MVAYQIFGTIKRPVLRRPVLGLADLRGLPPWAWCCRCGAEVFEPGNNLCRRCKGELRVKN